MKKPGKAILGLSMLASALLSVTAVADSYYEVTVTNITKGLTFTPALVATTRKGDRFFRAGYPASIELETIAESGMSGALAGSLDAYDVASLGAIGNQAPTDEPGCSRPPPR